MKNIYVVTTLSLILFLSGCAFFGNEEQYDKGEWHFLTGSNEVARIKQDKLGIKKLEQTPAFLGPEQNIGYLGYVKNYTNEIVDIKVSGPETKSWHFSNAGEVPDYLIPGEYHCSITCRGKVVNSSTFHVGPQLKDFDYRKCHWYAYANYN
jgi:hypothetical protein